MTKYKEMLRLPKLHVRLGFSMSGLDRYGLVYLTAQVRTVLTIIIVSTLIS